MRKIILSICLIISTLGVFSQSLSQTKDTLVNNPDWAVKSKDQPYQRQAGSIQKEKPEWMQKLRYGGNFYLGYYNGAYIDVSPMVGYKLNEAGTTFGVGLNMIYTSSRFSNSSSFDYGARVFIQQPVAGIFFIQAEIEAMNARAANFYDYLQTADPLARKWEISPLVGVGFYPSKGNGSNYYFMLSYNLNYPNGGYNGPGNLGSGLVLKVGFF
jgi:hypothetical protein